MITMQNVRKTYGNFTFEISMELPEGQILGLIGKNGAGKSTAIKLILGLCRAEEGTVTVLGSDSKELYGKSQTGYRSFSCRIRIFRGTDRKRCKTYFKKNVSFV